VSTVLGNRPPIANAGLDQAVAVSETVTLDGALSADPDSDPLTYRWSLLARPVGSTTGLVNPNSAQPTFHVDRAGEYVAQLIVNDGAIDSAPDTVLVTSSNTPPVARAGDDQAAVVGDTLQFDGTASSDANDDALAFLWSLSSRPPGSSADLVGSATPTPLLTVDAAGVFVVQLIVNDGAIDSVPDTLIVSVDPPPNAAPQAQNDVASTDQDTPVAIAVLANDSDPDGDALTLVAVTQPAGGAAVIEGAEIRYLPAAGFSGNDAFDYTVSDGRGGESTASVRVEVRAPATLVTVVATDNIAAELGVNTGTFTISRSGDVSAALLVNIALLGTATNGVDFASVPSAVTIPAGAASVTVTIVPIVEKAGAPAVTPSFDTVKDGSYQPYARPIFIYVNVASLNKPEVKSFVDFYLTKAPALIPQVKYVPLPEKAYALAKANVANKKIGTGFGGVAEVGVSVEDLLQREGKH
jgi:hypothetical protein